MSNQLEDFQKSFSNRVKELMGYKKTGIKVTDKLIAKFTKNNLILEEFGYPEIDPLMVGIMDKLNNYKGKLGVQTIFSCQGHYGEDNRDSGSYLALVPTKEEDLVWIALSRATDIFTVEEVMLTHPSVEKVFLIQPDHSEEDIVYPAFSIVFALVPDEKTLELVHDMWVRYIDRLIEVFEEMESV